MCEEHRYIVEEHVYMGEEQVYMGEEHVYMGEERNYHCILHKSAESGLGFSATKCKMW